MANAKKCDRCGNFYSGVDLTSNYYSEIETVDGHPRYITISSNSHGDLDICPKCRESLCYWWKFVRSVDDFLHIGDKKQENKNYGSISDKN